VFFLDVFEAGVKDLFDAARKRENTIRVRRFEPGVGRRQ